MLAGLHRFLFLVPCPLIFWKGLEGEYAMLRFCSAKPIEAWSRSGLGCPGSCRPSGVDVLHSILVVL